MSDLAGYLNTEKNRVIRSIVDAEVEYVKGWCDRLGYTTEQIAERFDLRSETTTEVDGEVLRFVTRMKLERKEQS